MSRLRAHPLVLLAVALSLLGLVLAAAFAAGDTGATALTPFLGLLLPLLLGWYVGAERLERVLRRAQPRPRPADDRVPAARPRLLLRGGRLIACGLATRPPPASAGAA